MANGLNDIKAEFGADKIGALVSPHSTLEELYLAAQLVRGLGSENIDYRLRHTEFDQPEGIRWLGTTVESLSSLQGALIVGSNLRKDHPLFAQRIRQSVRHGAVVSAITSRNLLRDADAWAMPVQNQFLLDPADWCQALAAVAHIHKLFVFINNADKIKQLVNKPSKNPTVHTCDKIQIGRAHV